MALGPLSGMVTHAVQNGVDIPFNEYNTNLAYSTSHKYWKQQVDYLNQYNSPLNQIGRLQAAGLNPALAYGGIQNTSTASAGVSASPMPTKTPPNFMGAMEYQQLRTNREQEKGQKLQNELLEEKVEQEKIATDEAKQKHIGNVYSFQNAFRQAVAQGGLFYNPLFAQGWKDRSGVYNFKQNPSYDDVNGLMLDSTNLPLAGVYGSTKSFAPVQYDSALLSGYMLGKMYHDNFMKEYNTHEKDEARINTENERDRQNAQLDYENVESNYQLLKDLYKLNANQEYQYNSKTFDDMTNAAISGFKEAIAKNNLLTLTHYRDNHRHESM